MSTSHTEIRTPVSANTQAILLLTAPLITGRGEHSRELLTASEYAKLARDSSTVIYIKNVTEDPEVQNVFES